MREYELAVILHPDLEIDQDKALNKLEKIISELKGKLIKRDDWGKRKLAYPIAKQQFGLYFFWQLELEPANVKELERNLQIAGEVIRYLVVKYEPPIETGEAKQTEQTEAMEAKTKAAPKKSPAKTTAKSKEDK